MKRVLAVALAVCTLLGGVALAAEAQKVSFKVDGVACAGCIKPLAAALDEGGVKNATALTFVEGEGDRPVRIEGEITDDTDLSEAADLVNGADTPCKGVVAPGLSLVLFAELDKALSEKAIEALGEIEGVDAEKSSTDAEEGEISAKIKGGDKVTLADILEALKDAGIEASVVKE